jgi:2-polyprenyl-3-methyl-5-hydroxy-6-metoxy-1,4-benzoquinol methylase
MAAKHLADKYAFDEPWKISFLLPSDLLRLSPHMKSNRKSGDPASQRKGGTPFWEKMKPKASKRDSSQPKTREAPGKAQASQDKGWDQVAQWYEQMVGDAGSDYHKNVIVPAVMKRLGIMHGEKVIDVCCGQGFLGKLLLQAGAARVHGVDASPQLIAAAQQRGSSEKALSYEVADACGKGAWADGSYDVAICLMAVHDVPDLTGLFQNIASSIKERGKSLLVFMHPCFRMPQHSHWGWDAEKSIQYRRMDRYGSEKAITITTHPGRKTSEQTIFYHRPLPSYVRSISQAGLAITGCEELFTHRRSQAGPRSKAEHLAAEEFPLFLLWELRKCRSIQ